MLQITIDTKGLQQATDRLHLLTERQLQFAMVKALNATTQATAAALRTDLARTSGGPIAGGATRWTIGAVYQRKASTSTLTTEAGIRKDTPRAAGRYLLPMIKGDMPRRKAIDSKLSAYLGPAGRLAVMPADNTRLTQAGNISRQRFNSVVSRIGRPGQTVFIAPLRHGDDRGAVWERYGPKRPGKRQAIRPLFLLLPPERRRSTWDLAADLRSTVDHVFPGQIRTALREELARAGFT